MFEKLNYEEFKQLLKRAFLDLHNDLSIADKEDSLFIKKGEHEALLNVNMLYERHLSGEPFEHLSKMVVEPFFTENSFFERTENWDSVKLNVYPQIKNPSDFGEELLETLLYRSSPIPNIIITYVVDAPNGMMYITHNWVSEKEVSEEELISRSLRNLQALSKKRGLKLMKEGGTKFYYSNSNDGYDASRILTANYDQIKKTLKGKVYVGIPNRDMLIFFNGNEAFAKHFIQQNKVQYASQRYRLTPFTYEWNGKMFLPILE